MLPLHVFHDFHMGYKNRGKAICIVSGILCSESLECYSKLALDRLKIKKEKTQMHSKVVKMFSIEFSLVKFKDMWYGTHSAPS